MLTVDQIKELIQTIDHSSITDFNYEANGVKVALKKQSELPIAEQKEQQVPIKQVQQQPAKEIATEEKPESNNHSEAQQTESATYDYEITSPMVGTFYAKASPENDNYVEKGSQVTSSTTVCIVEAMKLFNEIEAEVDGEITEILVTDGELVEYGQPLFRVKKK